MDDLLPAPNALAAGVHQAVQPQQPPSQGQPNPDLLPGQAAASADQVTEQDASPEEQAQYTQVVHKALQYLRAKKGEAIKQMQPMQGESPSDAIGRFVAGLLRNIDASATKAGENLSGDVIFNAGVEVAEQVARLAVAAGVVAKPDDPDKFANEIAVAAMNNEIQRQAAMGNPMQQQAQQVVTQQVAKEVDKGEAPQGFLGNAPEVPRG